MCKDVFLHADLMGRLYPAIYLIDGLEDIEDIDKVISSGQISYEPHLDGHFRETDATEKAKQVGQVKVKGEKCLVLDRNSKNIKLKLFWLPNCLEDGRIAEALEPFGQVRSIVRENWKDAAWKT